LNLNGSLGGAERALLDLMQAVHQACPNWALKLVTGSEGDFATAARRIGIDVHILPLPTTVSQLGDAGAGGPAGSEVSKLAISGRLSLSAPQLAAYVWKLRAFATTQEPDLIHSNAFKTHILAVWAAPRRSKIVWHVHDYVHARPLMSRLMRIHASGCAVAVTNSHSVARDLDRICRGKLKIHTVYNAVDLERFNPKGPILDLDAMSGLPTAPDGTVRVGLIATMARWKGHEAFIRAVAMLAKDLPIRAYLIGGPIYTTVGSQYTLDELRALVSELGIAQRVGLTGFMKNADAAVRALDIVVHASTRPEPFGLVVAEAMACGKPIVASRTGGVREIISENENALGYRPGDSAAMVGCIERLARDRALREKMGGQARRWAEERFHPSRLAREVLPIYRSVQK